MMPMWFAELGAFCRTSLSQQLQSAYQGFYGFAEGEHTARPDSFVRQVPYVQRFKDAAAKTYAALPHDPIGRAAVVTVATTLGYLAAASALPALCAVSPALLGAGLIAVFGLETLRSHDKSLAIACVAGALVGALTLSLLTVTSAAWFAAGVLLTGAAGLSLVLLARKNAISEDADPLPGARMPGSWPQQMRELPPEPMAGPQASNAVRRQSDVTSNTAIIGPDPDARVMPGGWPDTAEGAGNSEQGAPAPNLLTAKPEPKALPAPPVINSADAKWLAALRAKAYALTGPYADAYRSKIVALLDAVEGTMGLSSRCEVMDMLRKLDTLAQTLTPAVQPCHTRRTRHAALRQALNELPACNNELTQAILDATTQLWGGEADNARLVLSGASTNAEAGIARAITGYGGPSLTFDMARKGVLSLAGCKPVYVRPAASEITTLLLQNPDETCVVHIKDIELGSDEAQAKLLELFDPDRDFMDDYFGLPINKSRLLVVGTTEGFAASLREINPELWARIKAHNHTIRIKCG